MPDDRWPRVREVFGAARERPKESRAAFLAEACGGDQDLQREVESLLLAEQEAGGFLSAAATLPPPPPEAAPLQIGPYRIVGEVGRGGMGVVYEAEDTRLGRRVALKLLPSSLVGDSAARARLRREARAVSALNHPHICTVHDYGEFDAKPFIVMERMQGETLKQAMQAGRLPLARQVELAAQMADALAFAHRAGIVHRDIKPANVFVTAHGEAKLMDFGIARLVADDASRPERGPRSPSDAHLTRTGSILGTATYMSPEQARGEPLDGRSDLFSLGVVLYEMATERLPFEGATVAEVSSRITADDAPTLPSSLNPAIPARLEQVIRRALEKDRTLRYQTAADLMADLRSLLRDVRAGSTDRLTAADAARGPRPRRRVVVVAGLVVALALGGAWLARRAPPAAPPVVGEKRIAVLPFQNLGSAQDAYFADGMTDEVRTRLAGLTGLVVIASGSAGEYRASTKAPERIARELGVAFLLTAKVRWQEGEGSRRIRVTPELVEVAGTGPPITRWQETYEANVSDAFRVQGEIATHVAESLAVALSARQRGRLAEPLSANAAAYDAFLRGQAIEKEGNDPATNRRAAAQYEEAVALDPGFAVAWARLSAVRSLVYSVGVASPEEAEGARTAVERALALAPARAAPHGALGDYHRLVRKDFAAGLNAYERGLRISPDDVDLLRGVALAEQSLGRWEDALGHLRRARDLDPRSWRAERDLARTLLYVRRTLEARDAFDRGLALAPANLTLLEGKAITLLQAGDLEGARGVIAAAPKEVALTSLVAYFANYWELGWTLTADQQEVLLRLTPSAFADDKGEWGLALTQAAAHVHDEVRQREFAETARKDFAAQLARGPEDSLRRACLGLVLAYAGRKAEAMREADHALARSRRDNDARSLPHVQYLALRTAVVVGDHDKALELLEPLLTMPYYVTPGWLRIDADLEPLRDDPRFRSLAR